MRPIDDFNRERHSTLSVKTGTPRANRVQTVDARSFLIAELLGSGVKLTVIVNKTTRGKNALDVLERRFAIVVDVNDINIRLKAFQRLDLFNRDRALLVRSPSMGLNVVFPMEVRNSFI